MTNDEIKKALRERCRIRHKCRKAHTAIVYQYAQAWRVTVDKNGQFVFSLELVTGGNPASMTVALADECEIWTGKGDMEP